MTQQIFFMAGLPRSGSTLLSSLLNQNPNIFSSPQSPLLHIMGLTYNTYYEVDNQDVNRDLDISNVLDVIPEPFYKNYSQEIIIDKSFRWTDNIPFALLERHLKNPIKIICPVRDVLEVLASFNKLAEQDINNGKDIEVVSTYFDNLSMPDKRARYWMDSPLSDIRTSLEGMKKSLSPKYKDMFHFVEYNDLLDSPEKVLRDIYSFLDLPYFNHSFDNIVSPFIFNDSYGFKNHHIVRPQIAKISDDPKTIFSDETIEKYSGLEFWRHIKDL